MRKNLTLNHIPEQLFLMTLPLSVSQTHIAPLNEVPPQTNIILRSLPWHSRSWPSDQGSSAFTCSEHVCLTNWDESIRSLSRNQTTLCSQQSTTEANFWVSSSQPPRHFDKQVCKHCPPKQVMSQSSDSLQASTERAGADAALGLTPLRALNLSWLLTSPPVKMTMRTFISKLFPGSYMAVWTKLSKHLGFLQKGCYQYNLGMDLSHFFIYNHVYIHTNVHTCAHE